MTTALFNDRSALVAAALAQHSSPNAAGKASWRFQPRQTTLCSVMASLVDEWLVLVGIETPELLADASLWDLVQRNTALPGFAKFALMPDGGLQLRAELLVLEEADLDERIRATCAGFESACAVYQFAGSRPAPAPPGEKAVLKELCAEAGWPFIERGPDKLLIELETPGNFRQAAMVQDECGIHLSCDLAACGALAGESRDAMAQFLLSVSGVLRFARASVVADMARLEVAFTAPACAAEISSCLESLSVGCSLCGEEIKSLQDPAIARCFLALRGRSAEMVA